MSENIQKIEKAIELIQEARDLIDSVLKWDGDLAKFSISSEYYDYGEWGLRQAVGEGNPYDGKLQNIIETLEAEDL